MFLTGFNDYEHDRFQNLTIRFVAGGGPGVKAVKSENIQLDFDAGIDYQREDFLNGLNRNSAEANFGDNLSYQVSKGTSVTQSMRVFTNLSDTGSYRVNFDIGSSTILKRWLGWHVTASDRFLSERRLRTGDKRSSSNEGLWPAGTGLSLSRLYPKIASPPIRPD
jgi:hypothetical protein